METTIYSSTGTAIAKITVGSNSYVFSQIMGDHYLQLEFSHGEYIDIKRDSYVIYQGVKYTLIDAVNVEKMSTVEYNYSARFESPQELLANVIYKHMAEENQYQTKAYECNFTLAGTAEELINMLILNTQRLKVNFRAGHIDDDLTGVKVVGFNFTDCKSALQLIANAFETEWYILGNERDGYTVNLGKCSFDENEPTRLAYGYDNGVLSGIKRNLHADAVRCTHIAVQGGGQNINTLSQIEDMAKYQFATLHLPVVDNTDPTTGIGTIYYDVANNKFEGETGFNMQTSVLLTIDRKANTMTSSLFREGIDVVVERAYDMSEYYPQATRNVTAFGFNSNFTEFWVEDSGIEESCDYKIYQLGGEKITIVFQTGALAGKTFDVIDYIHDKNNKRRRFECALADYDTIKMPSTEEPMWQPVLSDEFIVYGCALPQSYFADRFHDPKLGAEWDMCRRTASILCENFRDKYAYSLTLDSNWLSRRTEEERNRLRCGFGRISAIISCAEEVRISASRMSRLILPDRLCPRSRSETRSRPYL